MYSGPQQLSTVTELRVG